MSTLNLYIGGALALIALYLIVAQGNNSNQILTTLSSANVNAVKALQGR